MTAALRDAWDAQAASVEDARNAVWAEHDTDWDARADACLAVIEPHLLVEPLRCPRILDLGCGVGRLAVPLARRWPDATIVGVDISPRMLSYARAAADDAEVTNVELLAGDGTTLPDKVGELDAVYSMVAFQHMPDETMFGYLDQIQTRLRPHGRVRFQFVDEGDFGPLNFPRPLDTVLGWLGLVGLELVVAQRAMFNEWCWVTAAKPGDAQ